MANIDSGNMLTGVTQSLDNNMRWLGNDNDMVKLLVVLVAVYAVFFVGKIFPIAMNITRSPFVKLALFIAIALVARHNVPLAFVLTIAIVSVMMTNLKNTNEFMTADDLPYTPMRRGCICRCNENGCQCICTDQSGRRCSQAEAEVENEMVAQEVEAQEQEQEEEQEEIAAEMEEEDERAMLMNFNKRAVNTIERQMMDHEIQKNKGSLRDLDHRIYIPNSSPTPQDLYSYSVDMDYSPVKF